MLNVQKGLEYEIIIDIVMFLHFLFTKSCVVTKMVYSIKQTCRPLYMHVLHHYVCKCWVTLTVMTAVLTTNKGSLCSRVRKRGTAS